MTDDNKLRATEKLISEWQNLKYYINDNIKPNIPEDVRNGKKSTPTEWLLLQLLRNTTLENFYPSVIQIAGIILAIPITNAWPERGASCLKSIKTKSRNRLSETMLESILHICINGPEPESEEGRKLVKLSFDTWVKAKNRRKLPKLKVKDKGVSSLNVQQEKVTLMQDASMQTDDDPVIAKAKQVLDEVRCAMKVMALGEVSDNDSDFDEDSKDDSDSDW